MRPWILGSVIGHIVLILGVSVLSSLKSEAMEFGEIIQVDLQSLELPAEAVEEEPPPPEPEEVPVDVPEPEPELPESMPEPEIAPEPVPPEPDLPPEPEVEEEPEQVEEPLPELPEPEEITPQPKEPAEDLTDPVEPDSEAQAGPEVSLSPTAGMPDYYLGIVLGKLRQRWDPPASAARGRRGIEAVVSFRIARNGNILDAEIVSSSGLSHVDRMALRALFDASPLPSPPSTYLQAGSLPLECAFALD